jgi:DNA-binding SARP family transcriptional activator
MRIDLLGPLRILDDEGTEGTVAGSRLRVLLTLLAVRANRPVTVDEIAEMLWDGAPPTGAAVTVRAHVKRLRNALGPAGTRIATRSPGYLISLSEVELDLTYFQTLCEAGSAAIQAGQWQEAQTILGRALAMWRGTPLVDIPSQTLRDQELPRLEQLRMHALAGRIESDLHLGHHDRLVPELRELTLRHPLREQFHAQLMLALARCGRQADALSAYRDARRILASELGIEPGPELRALQQRILAGDTEPITTTHRKTSYPAADVLHIPRQLPAAARHFTGRAAELKLLTGLLDEADGSDSAVVISVIGGTAGIGKTALAVHWAHQHADRFPDGQLYVNLRGFDPTGAPVDVGSAVRGFLDALAVPAAGIPVGLDAQLALYRSRLADTRTLVVLDNARDVKQLRPLLPGAATCLVLVTSRSRLTGLVAVDGAVPLTLGLLSTSDARELLGRRLGAQRVSSEERATDELVDLCARLPLALNIAAARALTHPARRLDALVDELREGTGLGPRLAAISDELADVRAVLSWSYQTLDGNAARIFRLLGLHRGPEFDIAAAASLAGVPYEQARKSLDELAAAHLLTEYVPGRYTFHDLLRAYAAELACAHDTDGERRAATYRFLDHYLHTGRAAFQLSQPGWLGLDLGQACPGVTLADLANRDEALAWYQAELAGLHATVAQAAEGGFDGHVWKIVWSWSVFLNLKGLWHELTAVSEIALTATRSSGDSVGQAFAHSRLGAAFAALGSYSQARTHLQQALVYYKSLGDATRQGNTHRAIAALDGRLEYFTEALAHEYQALELYRAPTTPAVRRGL